MSDLIERVGRAIADADGEDYMEDCIQYDRRARAAIVAMRKPTEAMILAPSDYRDERPDHWRAMIEAALKP